MKPVADARKPSSGSNLTNGVAPSPTGWTSKTNMFLSMLPAACCAFMLYSSVTAIVDSHGDPSTVFFVVFSLTILGLLYLSMREFEKAVAVKDDQKRDRLLSAVLLKILFSYRVTSVLNSPVMIGVIWGIAAVTSLPLAESIQLPIEASNATDNHLQVYILTVCFLCGCSVSIFHVARLATLEFPRAVITKDLLRSKFLKIIIFSLLMFLTGLCTYRASSVLQVGLMTAAAWTIAVLSWSAYAPHSQKV